MKSLSDLGQGLPCGVGKNQAEMWLDDRSGPRHPMFIVLNPSRCYSAGSSGRLVKEIEKLTFPLLTSSAWSPISTRR